MNRYPTIPKTAQLEIHYQTQFNVIQWIVHYHEIDLLLIPRSGNNSKLYLFLLTSCIFDTEFYL